MRERTQGLDHGIQFVRTNFFSGGQQSIFFCRQTTDLTEQNGARLEKGGICVGNFFLVRQGTIQQVQFLDQGGHLVAVLLQGFQLTRLDQHGLVHLFFPLDELPG